MKTSGGKLKLNLFKGNAMGIIEFAKMDAPAIAVFRVAIKRRPSHCLSLEVCHGKAAYR